MEAVVKEYSRSKHRFFDSLTGFIATYASYALSFRAQQKGKAEGFKSDDRIGLGGNPDVTNVALSLAPKELMDKLSANEWPETIEMKVHEPPTGKSVDRLPQIPRDRKLTGLQGLMEASLTPLFVDYYESVVDEVRNNYGDDTTNWPSEWNFGRVIRNAFSHGGEIYIRNLNADPVEWRGLEYSSSKNERYVLFQDLATVEVIFLMEDMDRAI
jgi:hypothetical protein